MTVKQRSLLLSNPQLADPTVNSSHRWFPSLHFKALPLWNWQLTQEIKIFLISTHLKMRGLESAPGSSLSVLVLNDAQADRDQVVCLQYSTPHARAPFLLLIVFPRAKPTISEKAPNSL